MFGCVSIEWRGGMTPSLNWKKKTGGERFLETKWDQNRTFRLDGNASIADWPDFRGPGRRGVAPNQGRQINWEKEPTLIWRKPAGPGHSSLIIVDGRLYTLEQEGEFETLNCRSLKDGSIIWKHKTKDRLSDSMGGTGPRSTPVYAKGKIFSISSHGKLACLDAVTGKLVWEISFLEPDYEYPHWGIASSPLIVNNLVVVSPGGQLGAVKAYDLATGGLRWISELKGTGVYLSPMALTLLGETHLVAAVEGKIAGLNPETGHARWEYPWKIFMTNAQIAQPVPLSKDTFLLSAGYGKGAMAIQLKNSTSGISTQEIWKSKNLKTKFSSPVERDGYIYGFNESSLTCLDARTSELKWRGKKYGYGRILLVEGKLLVMGNTGRLSIIDAEPDGFHEISSHQILGKERCWNGPALVGGYLVVRNGSEIACYDLAAQ